MRMFTADHISLVFLLAEKLLLVLSGSGLWGNLWSILELFSRLLLSWKLGGKLGSSLGESSSEMFREALLDGARKLDLSGLRELMVLLIDEDFLDLRIHGGLAFAFILRLAEIIQILLDGGNSDIIFLFSESHGNSSIIFELSIKLDGAVKTFDAVVGSTVSGRFANFIDMVERGVIGEGAIDEIIGAVVVGNFASESITATFLAAASDAHRDEARNDHHGKEADDTSCDGSVKGFVLDGILHDET